MNANVKCLSRKSRYVTHVFRRLLCNGFMVSSTLNEKFENLTLESSKQAGQSIQKWTK